MSKVWKGFFVVLLSALVSFSVFVGFMFNVPSKTAKAEESTILSVDVPVSDYVFRNRDTLEFQRTFSPFTFKVDYSKDLSEAFSFSSFRYNSSFVDVVKGQTITSQFNFMFTAGTTNPQGSGIAYLYLWNGFEFRSDNHLIYQDTIFASNHSIQSTLVFESGRIIVSFYLNLGDCLNSTYAPHRDYVYGTYIDGYQAGFEEGVKESYDVGYQAGYEQAVAEFSRELIFEYSADSLMDITDLAQQYGSYLVQYENSFEFLFAGGGGGTFDWCGLTFDNGKRMYPSSTYVFEYTSTAPLTIGLFLGYNTIFTQVFLPATLPAGDNSVTVSTVKVVAGEGSSFDQFIGGVLGLSFTSDSDVPVTVTGLKIYQVYNAEDMYQSGYEGGYSSGYTQGHDEGRRVGYEQGFYEGQQFSSDNNFSHLISTVVGAPVQVVQSFLNFEILGVNILGTVAGLLTLLLIVKVVKLFL